MKVLQLVLCFAVTSTFGQINPLYKISLIVYHEYQPQFESLGLANQNTGDLNGDAFFVLRSFLLPVECNSTDPAAKFDCDNPEQNNTNTNVISKHIVDVDDRFGDYGKCNVVNGSFYVCVCGDNPLLPQPCNASVGRSDVASRYDKNPPKPSDEDWKWWRVNLARKIGGNWYSTLAKGECTNRTGKSNGNGECYWQLNQTVRRIQSACLLQRVGSAVVKQNTSCFDACPQPGNSSSVCYSDCFMTTLLSPAASSHLITPVDGVPNSIIQLAWDNAFDYRDAQQGGCPDA